MQLALLVTVCGSSIRQMLKKRRRTVTLSVMEDEMSSQTPRDSDYDLMDVPVVASQCCIKLKRYMDKDGLMRCVQSGLPAPPPIILLHDGPGLPSRYLEPLAKRLCSNGRSCYMYDQLGCGLSTLESSERIVDDLQSNVDDFLDVMIFLKQSLGEAEVHVVAHGFGGALLMETLVRRGWNEDMPKLRSICLMSVSSSTALADHAANTLMAAAARSVGSHDAARAFWYRHVCALKPQPTCLADAYRQSAGRRWGALRGWQWKQGPKRWELRGSGALDQWNLTALELDTFAQSAPQFPVLCLRGQHDFVTEECVSTWRALASPSVTFTESVLGGCGHNAHLEAPDSVAAALRLWLLDAEDTSEGHVARVPVASTVVRKKVKCRVLLRDEARHQLKTWASQLSWASQRAPMAKPGAWRSVGQGLPHRDAFAPSRTARRLAEWAAQLLPSKPPRCTDSMASIGDILAEDSVRGWRGGRMALAVVDDALSSATCGIVCIEKKSSLQIVGVAKNPTFPGSKSLCEDAVDEIEAAIESSK